MVGWTIATWVITPIALIYFGFNGFALSSAVIATSIVIVVWVVKKEIDFSLKPIFTPIFATIILGVVLWVLTSSVKLNIYGIFATIVFGIAIYFSVVFLMARKSLIADFKVIRRQFVK
jgi:uncharacterized membrane protein YeaQ/YmgE (transglycosylase-associated protein family)